MKKVSLTEQQAKELYLGASEEIKVNLEKAFGKEIFQPKTIQQIVAEYLEAQPLIGTLEEKAVLAFNLLLEITKYYNGNWIPDWNNPNQYKYQPYFYKNGGLWVAYDGWAHSAGFPSGLCHETREKALESIREFPEIWKAYYMIE